MTAVYCAIQGWILLPFVLMPQAYNQFRDREGRQ